MTKHKSLFRIATEGFAVTAAGELLGKTFGIVSTFVILAWLAPYDYGVWRLLQSVMTGASIITLSGVTGIVVADIARELGAKRETAAQAIIWRITQLLVSTGIIAGGVLLVAAPVLSMISGINLTLYLWILALSVAFGNVTQLFQTVFQAKLQPAHASLIKTLGNVTYLAGIGFLVAQYQLGLLGLVVAYTLSVAVPVLLYVPYFVKQIAEARREREHGTYSLRDALWKKGRWALANDYVSIIASASWPWITGYFIGIEEVGYAGLAIVLISQVFSIVPFQYILRGILPRFSEDTMRMQEWLQRGMRYSLWIHLVAGVAVISAALIVFPFLFPAYVPAIAIAAALLLSVPFRAMSAVLTEWFYATSSQKDLFFTSAVPKLGALALLPFLLLLFGMPGFVIWYVLSADVVLVLRLRKVKRELALRTDFRSLFLPDAKDFELIGRGLARLRLGKLG